MLNFNPCEYVKSNFVNIIDHAISHNIYDFISKKDKINNEIILIHIYIYMAYNIRSLMLSNLKYLF